MILRRFSAFENFARALTARTYAHARIFWPETDRTDIDLDLDKYEWEMTFRYEDYDHEFIFRKFHKMAPMMNSSVKVKVENLTVLCPYAYTYVC